jgi:hypothetical protein
MEMKLKRTCSWTVDCISCFFTEDAMITYLFLLAVRPRFIKLFTSKVRVQEMIKGL